MFCPNCGQKINIEQVYCRACGMGISEMSQKLAAYGSDSIEKVDWLKRIGLFSMGLIFCGTLSLGAVVFVNAFRLIPITAIVFFMLISAILTGLVCVLYFEKDKSKKRKNKAIENTDYAKPVFENRNTNRKLNESTFAPIGSVTDNTTELFTVKTPRTRTSGELG